MCQGGWYRVVMAQKSRWHNWSWILSIVLLLGLSPGSQAIAQNSSDLEQPTAEANPEIIEPGLTGTGEKPVAEKPTIFDQQPSEAVSTIWNATLFTAGDTEIKLNQIVIALFTAIIGLWLAKLLTSIISARLVKVSKVTEAVAFTIGKIIYYIAAAMVLLIAMQVAGIPTTVFTVLGGALAIGVGFGAQNLFNNLISGIIILTEKPIRRNDIIEVDGMEGKVAEIGNRRTRIRTGDGIDVLVPNSKFLENNVVNWTLYDAKVRGNVSVGVAYGTNAKKVRELLCEAVSNHDKIHSTPVPIVFFEAFGDNTLNFKVFFWTEVKNPSDLQLIESDVRFSIDELFHEHKITIAFPQRDVHLDTLKPLQVHMVKSGAESDAGLE